MARSLLIPVLSSLLCLVGACAAPSGLAQDAPSGHGHDEVVPYAEQDAATRADKARLKGYFPNHTLTTHEGSKLRFYEDLVRDKQVLINFMYVDCDGL